MAAAPRPRVHIASMSSVADYASAQAKRRESALSRQKAARDATVTMARALVSGGAAASAASGGGGGGGSGEGSHDDNVDAETVDGEAVVGADSAPSQQQQQQQQQQPNRARRRQPQQQQQQQHQKQQQRWYAAQLMTYDWLASCPPSDLGTQSWLVLPRPGGTRCLVTSGRGGTVARAARTGRPLFARPFASLLPGGGGAKGSGPLGPEAHCALDCVCLTSSSSPPAFVVLDVIEWRGVALAGCSAAARQLWLAAKAAEGESESGLLPPEGLAAADASPTATTARFALAGASPASEGALAAAASGAVAAARGWGSSNQEGVLLLHAEGDYVGGGALGSPWPLALAWKDERCAVYVVETTAASDAAAAATAPADTAQEPQTVTLRLQQCEAVTADDPPHALADSLPSSLLCEAAAASSSLHRFAIVEAAVATAPLPLAPPLPPGLALVHLGPASQWRLHADGLSKILFQAMARRGALPTIEDLIACVRRNEEAAAEEQRARDNGAGAGMAVD